MGKQNPFWKDYSDEELLGMRFCDLKLSIQKSRLQNFIDRLYRELKTKKLNFKPHIWLSEEWFAADGIPGIAIPFYLCHPRLIELEKSMVFEAEGEKPEMAMRLLRHEAGHAIDNAFLLRRNKKRQSLFGLSSTPYPESYSPKAFSRKFVVNLDSWYAQAHPDEDWAESFAVWLNPKSNWRKKYAKWPAVNKLKLVNEMMKNIQGKRPLIKNNEKPIDLAKSKKTLRSHYKKRRKSLGLEYQFYFEPLATRIFSNEEKFLKKRTAVSFLKQERKVIRQKVALWTGQYQYTINFMINDLIECCMEKKLRLKESEKNTRASVISMLTAQTMNYIMSGQNRVDM